MFTMGSKLGGFALAKDIRKVMVFQRNSGKICRFRGGGSGMKITLLRLELQVELDRTFKATG